MNTCKMLVLLVVGAVLTGPMALPDEPPLAIETDEFIYTKAPFPECHASTIVELQNGDLMTAWFGGKKESHKSTEIWVSRKTKNGEWSAPKAATSFPDTACWNPVLFRDARNLLWLFFKVGSDESNWVGAYRTSDDGGHTWSDVTIMPAGLLGPIRCKPITLSDGAILSPSSVEAYRTWSSWMERSIDGGKTWSLHGPLVYPGVRKGLIQPTVWEASDGRVITLMRSTRKIGVVAKSTSADGGKTWAEVQPTSLPNPNSGIDAVKLKDGRVALIYNHIGDGQRTVINLAFSSDDGETWGFPHVLEEGPGEYSYPAIIQTADGKLHMTYTWKRKRIKHIVVNP